jgi:hypothetical protein
MLTAGDIQYEPHSPKTFLLTKFVVAMMSGDAAFYTEIMEAVGSQLEGRQEERVPVGEIARMFVSFRNNALRRRASDAILSPLGLTSETFLLQQRDMDPQLVDKLATELLNFGVPAVDVIVTGIDEHGTQIYVMVDGDLSCNNAIGFASVGSGARHAESQLMLARHSPSSTLSETLFLTYVAKKRSEVAPGVGQDTDMVMIDPGVGVSGLNADIVSRLEKAYADLQQKEKATFQSASEEVAQYVAEITAQANKTEVASGKPASIDAKVANRRKKPSEGTV